MSNKSNSGGIGFIGLLTILFIGLKLTHYINWSWWWVLCPLWLPAAIIIPIGIVMLIIGYNKKKQQRDVVGEFLREQRKYQHLRKK